MEPSRERSSDTAARRARSCRGRRSDSVSGVDHQKKRWDGYVSWSYLEPGAHRHVDLVPQIGRVLPFVYPLSAEDEIRAQRLVRETVCISLHDHAGVMPVDLAENDAYIREGRESYGYEGLAASGLDAIFENFLDGTASITSKAGWKWTDVIHDLGMHLADVAHQSIVFAAGTVNDIIEAHRSGHIAMIPCLEGAAPLENELDRLDVLFGLGIRMCGIAYSESNQLGGGIRDPADGGLTLFGRQCVVRMNRLGMAIDLSHTGDVTALQTSRLSAAPVFLSHSGARALFPMLKLKDDDLLRAVADTGGVCGIEASPHSTIGVRHPRHSLDSVMEHLEYCVGVMGIEHVGLGPDLVFGDHVGLHRLYADVLDAGDEPDHDVVDYVEGLENLSEFPNIIRWLVAHGYSDDEIEMLLGGNILRALRDVWL
jgi:membrane dipeptidase